MRDYKIKILMFSVVMIGLLFFKEINETLKKVDLMISTLPYGSIDQQMNIVNALFVMGIGIIIGFLICSALFKHNKIEPTVQDTTKPLQEYKSTTQRQTMRDIAIQQMIPDPITSIGDAFEDRKNDNSTVITSTFQRRRELIKQQYEGKLISDKGTLIKNIRTRFGLSQKEFGEIIGVAPNMVSRYENNNARLSYNRVRSIIERFDLPVNYFV